jgi:hypothetical protein
MNQLMKCPNDDFCYSETCPHKGIHTDNGFCDFKCTNYLPWIGYCHPVPPAPQSKE